MRKGVPAEERTQGPRAGAHGREVQLRHVRQGIHHQVAAQQARQEQRTLSESKLNEEDILDTVTPLGIWKSVTVSNRMLYVSVTVKKMSYYSSNKLLTLSLLTASPKPKQTVHILLCKVVVEFYPSKILP